MTNLAPTLLCGLWSSNLFRLNIFRGKVYSGITFSQGSSYDYRYRPQGWALGMWIGRCFLKGVIIYFCSRISQTFFVPQTGGLKLASVCLVYWLIGSLSDNSGLQKCLMIDQLFSNKQLNVLPSLLLTMSLIKIFCHGRKYLQYYISVSVLILLYYYYCHYFIEL